MDKTIEDLLKENNGYLCTADVVAAGISKTYLKEYVKKNNLYHVAHGVYLSDEVWPDDYYIIYLRSKRIIYSHESALYLQQMMEHEPPQISVTVCAGYNATHLRKKGIHVYQVKKELYDIGKSSIKTIFGNEVAVYDRERTICDAILSRDNMDTQTYQTALKEYMGSRNRDLNKLMKYAELFKIEKLVKMYMDVLV